jgi:hypothetical protein
VRRYLPYLIPGALIALAVFIVATRPDEEAEAGLSRAEVADIKSRAASLSRESLQAKLEEETAALQQELPEQLPSGRVMHEAGFDGLTLNTRISLTEDESSVDLGTFDRYLKEEAWKTCQVPRHRLLLEAGVVFVVAYETADGQHIRYERLSKDSCRK